MQALSQGVNGVSISQMQAESKDAIIERLSKQNCALMIRITWLQNHLSSFHNIPIMPSIIPQHPSTIQIMKPPILFPQHRMPNHEAQPPNTVSPNGFNSHNFVQPTPHSYFSRRSSGKYNTRKSSRQTSRKNRVQCKACCTFGCRSELIKDLPIEDVLEATRERNAILDQLPAPEFFGEPHLNFPEFIHYSPIFRPEALEPDALYFKIPRTTKIRELSFPRKLSNLHRRTFGAEAAPNHKAFKRLSPHGKLCVVRMAVRQAVIHCLKQTIVSGVRTYVEGNQIFTLIFRFSGVAMVKTICNNLPQVFSAVVALEPETGDDSSTDSESITEAYECTGVVGLRNYHLFRRRIKHCC